MDIEKKSKWKLIAGILLIVQAILSAGFIGVILWINLLPMAYVCAIALVLLLALCGVYILFYAGLHLKTKKERTAEQKKTRRIIRHSVGSVLSALVMVVCIVGSTMLIQAGGTLLRISSAKKTAADVTAVYVLKTDPAETVVDAKDYTFAITESVDYENTKKTIDKINETVGVTIRTVSYDTLFDMADALYQGEAQAMILNTAYAGFYESEEDYRDFAERTKTLFDHEIEQEDTQQEIAQQLPGRVATDLTKDPFVIYISGSDTRNTSLNEKTRSDVNILAVINPNTKQILLINTPRDAYVDISIAPGQKDKLTHCGAYGIDCSMDTLGSFFDEPIDYYAKINFNGFTTLIDAIGGIDIEVEKSFVSKVHHYSYSKGVSHMTGDYALDYVRERYAFADGDHARGRHQMQMIKAVVQKASSGSTIMSNYSDILASLEGLFITDMPSSQISALAKMQLSDMASWNIQSFSVSGQGSKQHVYSMPGKRTYVLVPDEQTIRYARLLVDKTVDGVILSEEDMVLPDSEELTTGDAASE